MEKFKGNYRIESTRLQNWDYGWAALYFITICTADRKCWFGEIKNGQIVLSAIGKTVQTEWLKTFEMRPDMHLTMGEFIVMPNHFHAIIGIGENQYNKNDAQPDGWNTKRDGFDGYDDCDGGDGRDAMHCVSTTTNTTKTIDPPVITNPTMAFKNQFGPQSKNLASIVRGFKSAVTKIARMTTPGFVWQSRFNGHIIRDHDIAQYIRHNPAQWQEDSHNPENPNTNK